MITRRLFITGQVQGVGYRAWFEAEAQDLGLHGWVRNLHDGRVEALIHGPEGVVTALTAKARSGPPLARVSHLETSDEDIYDGAARFETKPTA